MSMPGSTEACKASVRVLSSAKAWLVLLTGLLSPVQCSDMLKKCELHQDLPDLLVPVLPVGADVPAKKTQSVSKERCGRLCHRADGVCLGCQPWG